MYCSLHAVLFCGIRNKFSSFHKKLKLTTETKKIMLHLYELDFCVASDVILTYIYSNVFI